MPSAMSTMQCYICSHLTDRLNRMLNPEEVDTFLAIARLGTLGQAAKTVHSSQSTVSHRLQSLERRLGYALIERSRGAHRTALTPLGQRFFALAERWESLVREAQELRNAARISMSVGTADAIDTYIMPSVYRNLFRVSPEVSLRIEIAAGPELCDRIVKRHLDVAYVFSAREHADLCVRPLISSPMVLVRAANSSRLGSDGAVRVDSLSEHREIYLPWGPDFDLWRRRFLSGDVLVHAAKAHSIVPFLTIPETWSVVPRFMVARLRRLTGCTVHEIVDPPPDRVILRVTNRQFGSPGAHLLETLDVHIQNAPQDAAE